MKGAWNQECCFDNQNSIMIDRLHVVKTRKSERGGGGGGFESRQGCSSVPHLCVS